MYFEKAEDQSVVPVEPLSATLGIILLLAVIVLGVAPGYLMDTILRAVQGISF
jgi:hypothetical protein